MIDTTTKTAFLKAVDTYGFPGDPPFAELEKRWRKVYPNGERGRFSTLYVEEFARCSRFLEAELLDYIDTTICGRRNRYAFLHEQTNFERFVNFVVKSWK